MEGKEAWEGAGEGERVVSVCAVWEGGWGRLEGEHGAMVGCKRTPPCELSALRAKKLRETARRCSPYVHVWDLTHIPTHSSHFPLHIVEWRFCLVRSS